jgi:cholesterol transport system auxiliary component
MKQKAGMLRTTVTYAALCSAAMLLSSCVSFGGKAPPSMLVLTAKKVVPKGTGKTGLPTEALIVVQPESPRKLETNRLPVQVNASNIAYLKDALWADKPARLMQQLLMEVIAASNSRLVLSEADAGGRATDQLSGSLLEFGLDSSSNEAIVIFDAVRIRSGKPIEKRRFEVRKPVSAILPGPAGVALNDAANQVAFEIAAWIGSS